MKTQRPEHIFPSFYDPRRPTFPSPRSPSPGQPFLSPGLVYSPPPPCWHTLRAFISAPISRPLPSLYYPLPLRRPRLPAARTWYKIYAPRTCFSPSPLLSFHLSRITCN